MKRSSRYAIFYCDKCELLNGVIKLMLEMYPNIKIKTTSEIGSLLSEIERKLPEYVLVYLTVHDESHIEVVKSIREKVNAADTPVLIFQDLPDESELKKLSGRLQ